MREGRILLDLRGAQLLTIPAPAASNESNGA
jgi:hypothetical protein